MKIIKHPNPILRQACDPVTVFDLKLSAIVSKMFYLMEKHNGIGLSAPQVGISKRFFVCGFEPHIKNAVFINPEIIKLSCPSESIEGCLSIPGIKKKMNRFESCRIRAYNLRNEEFELETNGILAFCVQHELDHLNGKLIIDYDANLFDFFLGNYI